MFLVTKENMGLGWQRCSNVSTSKFCKVKEIFSLNPFSVLKTYNVVKKVVERCPYVGYHPKLWFFGHESVLLGEKSVNLRPI